MPTYLEQFKQSGDSALGVSVPRHRDLFSEYAYTTLPANSRHTSYMVRTVTSGSNNRFDPTVPWTYHFCGEIPVRNGSTAPFNSINTIYSNLANGMAVQPQSQGGCGNNGGFLMLQVRDNFISVAYLYFTGGATVRRVAQWRYSTAGFADNFTIRHLTITTNDPPNGTNDLSQDKFNVYINGRKCTYATTVVIDGGPWQGVSPTFRMPYYPNGSLCQGVSQNNGIFAANSEMHMGRLENGVTQKNGESITVKSQTYQGFLTSEQVRKIHNNVGLEAVLPLSSLHTSIDFDGGSPTYMEELVAGYDTACYQGAEGTPFGALFFVALPSPGAVTTAGLPS